MRRMVVIFIALAVLAGCKLPPEREPLRPLPEEWLFSYADMVARARAQASVALEAFFADGWQDLEDAGKGLEQTARFLPKASEPPAGLKETIPSAAASLRKEAQNLTHAARTKNVESANVTLQRITLQIRLLKAKE